MSRVFNMVGGGGGGDTFAMIVVAYPIGSICTATNGTKTLTAKNTTGSWVFKIPTPASVPEIWTVSCTDGGQTASTTVSITTEGQSVSVSLSYRVPQEYQEVEYLQSSGTQYFDSGFTCSASMPCKHVIDFDIQSSSEAWISSSWKTTGLRCGYAGNNLVTTYGYSYTNVSGTRYIGTAPNDSSYISTYTQGIFCQHNGSKYERLGVGKLYSYKIFKVSDDSLVRDYVPCYRKSDNVAGLWEAVTETFLVNLGSGTFIVGPDV